MSLWQDVSPGCLIIPSDLLWECFFIIYYPPESLMKMKDYSTDNQVCCTTSDMTDNPAYDTTRRLMANLSHNTTANLCATKNEESIVMHKNPTYATAAGIYN